MMERDLNRQKEMKKKEKDTRRHKGILYPYVYLCLVIQKYVTVEGG